MLRWGCVVLLMFTWRERCISIFSPLSFYIHYEGSSWLWPYGSWIYNYICNRYLSPLKLYDESSSWRGVLDTTFCDKVCQWLVTLRSRFHLTNKTDDHDIIDILCWTWRITTLLTNYIHYLSRLNASLNLTFIKYL